MAIRKFVTSQLKMSNATAAIAMKQFRSPQTVISRFVARRTFRSAALWALVFGAFFASKAIGLVNTYPTDAARQKVAILFSNNIGIEVLLGPLRRTSSVGSIVTWNTLGAMVIIGSIWMMLLAVKMFRGEEDAGRWEILLAGRTTPRWAAANVLAGLSASLSLFYLVIAVIFSLVGRAHGIGFNVGSALFFALAVVAGVAVFMMVGALAAQVLPTRGRAATVAAAVFGVLFLLRAIGDITNAHWLLNVTPFGWIEKLQPLSNAQPVWLLPLAGLIIILGALVIFFAGRRDLGEGIIADKNTANPRTALLNAPLTAAIRLARANIISWLFGIFATATLYGLMTKTAAQAFSQSASAQNVLNRLSHQSQTAGTIGFLGIVFFLQMMFIMAYAASNVSTIRRDEAEGYVDNFLVRPVSRLRWLSGRIFIAAVVIILAGLLTAAGTWVGVASQHGGVSFHTLVLASINALVPVIMTVGVGIFAMGVRPRLTSLLAYGVLAWSFLISMVSSGLNLNHWILDTSILNQVVFAPAANPRWGTNAVLVAISLALCAVGIILFNRRDLQPE
jgi:ABC-2 type transport system permease protein